MTLLFILGPGSEIQLSIGEREKRREHIIIRMEK